MLVQYTLLTEILKKAGVPSAQLVKMIKDFQISPSWGDIPLPTGTITMTIAFLYFQHEGHMCIVDVR